jgi:hypothetical protein
VKPSLADFFAAHIEWLGARLNLVPAERRTFARWVVRAHPELAKPYLSQPAEFRLVCREVHRGGKASVPNGVGEKTLRRYAEALMRRYLSLPEAERGRFREFLNDVLKQCPTERSLKRFLQPDLPS